MLPSLSAPSPARHVTLTKAVKALTVSVLSLSSSLAAVSASPAVIGRDLLDVDNSNSSASSSSITATASLTEPASVPPVLNVLTTEPSPSANPTGITTARPSGVLALPLRHVELGKGPVSGSIARRYFGNDVLSVYSAAYLAQIRFPDSRGGDSQVVDVLLDTGSFELFVNPDCAKSDVPDLCGSFGRYNASDSPTAEPLGNDFSIRYGGGSASGEYYKDSISLIPGTTITEQQFGVANRSDKVWFGIMGLGQGRAGNYIKYPVIVDSLRDQGFTESRLFSLELGPQAPASNPIQYTGEIVFGGLDRNKFAGNLRKVPTDPTQVYYSIQLTSLTNNPASGGSQPVTRQASAQFPISVVVDSGTTLTILPRSVVESLAARFPGAQYDGSGGYTVPCSYRAQRTGSVTFGFGGFATIAVSYADFIWVSGNTCHLGASWSSSLNLSILGASFLRGAYVVFDQDNAALYMAPYRSCGGGDSSLVAVPEGVDAAAAIVGACGPAAPLPSPSSSSTTSTTTTSLTSTTRSSTSSTTSTSTTATASASVLPIPVSSTRTSTSSPSSSSPSFSVTRAPGVSASPTTTFTSTFTRPVTYTITSCAAVHSGCTVGQITTSKAVFVTRICIAQQLDGSYATVPAHTVPIAATGTGAAAVPTATITIFPAPAAAVSCTKCAAAAVTVLPVPIAVVAGSSSIVTVAGSVSTRTDVGSGAGPPTVSPFTLAPSDQAAAPSPSRTTIWNANTNAVPDTDIIVPATGLVPAPAPAYGSASALPANIANAAVVVAAADNFAYATTDANAGIDAPAAAESTVTASVIPLLVPTSAAADSYSRGVRGRAATREDAGGVFGKVDVKLAAGVVVAILGAWL